MLTRLETLFKALFSAQTLWNTERRGGRSDQVAAVIELCEAIRQDTLDAGVLALRHDRRGQERLALIREGDGLADLLSDLNDQAVLITDYAREFEAINWDIEAESERAAAARDALQSAISEESVGKSLTGYRYRGVTR